MNSVMHTALTFIAEFTAAYTVLFVVGRVG
jgi:hypothetical protein